MGTGKIGVIHKAVIITILVGLIAVIPYEIYSSRRNTDLDDNAERFIGAFEVFSFIDEQPIVIEDLSAYITFDWDYVLFFDSYVQEEIIKDVVGLPLSKKIITGISEGMNQAIFIDDREVVCHLQGYPDRYHVYFEVIIDSRTGYFRLDRSDDLSFELKKREKYYILRYLGDK